MKFHLLKIEYTRNTRNKNAEARKPFEVTRLDPLEHKKEKKNDDDREKKMNLLVIRPQLFVFRIQREGERKRPRMQRIPYMYISEGIAGCSLKPL